MTGGFMPEDEVVFQINESIFQQLVDWQEKIEETEITEPDAETACFNSTQPLTEADKAKITQSRPKDSVN
ncbi:MAG: hypothetical protein KME19_22750 [Microcoleus vaginatus WJT46-NPBG5]|jgi:hypothetical protein|nr:hypothetical protein [Microcoleus vaginatus WJT46-NPBG5]